MSTTSLPFARACLLAVAFSLPACPAEEPTTTDATTTDATTDSDTTSDMTGSTSTTETSAPTSTEGTTDASTEPPPGDDTDSSTSGVVPPELEAACASACEKFIECDWGPPYEDVASCASYCIDNTPGGMCIAPSVALYECVGGLTCAELVSEEWVSCAAEEDALPEDCGEPDCENLGSSEGPDTCSFGYACPNSPSEEIRCEGDTCTCLVDGMPMGTCGSSEGFCALDPPDQAEIAFDCCGFEF